MPNIELITLDLDNTLWDVHSVIVKAEQDMVHWLGEQVPESLNFYNAEQVSAIREQISQKFLSKIHDLSFMRREILYEVMLLSGLPDQTARRRANEAFEVFFEGRNRVEFFPGALEMLAELRHLAPIYALTNGNADIEKAGLGDYLTGAFSSADVGASKPHPEMFFAPLEALGLSPHQAIHIGDNLVDDIHGAASVGMHSIWVNLTATALTQEDAQPTHEVTDLTAVVSAANRIAET